MIKGFAGDYKWLSNSYVGGPNIKYGSMYFESVENAYQAAKTNNLHDRYILSLDAVKLVAPEKAKEFGRRLQLRPNWDQIKVEIMRELLFQKFAAYPTLEDSQLTQRLLSTAPQYLVELNNWNDTFWGVCAGHGSNVLGKLLMQVRNEIHFALTDEEIETEQPEE